MKTYFIFFQNNDGSLSLFLTVTTDDYKESIQSTIDQFPKKKILIIEGKENYNSVFK